MPEASQSILISQMQEMTAESLWMFREKKNSYFICKQSANSFELWQIASNSPDRSNLQKRMIVITKLL